MKKKNLFINLMLVLLIVLLSISLVACNNGNNGENDNGGEEAEETPDKLTDGLLIDNSDFKILTTQQIEETFPYKPNSWNGSAFNKTAYPQGVIAGIVDFDPKEYDASKSIWNNLKNPNPASPGTDTRGLMIYMPKKANSSDKEHGATAFGYTSNKFQILKNSYYRLAVAVKTVDIGPSEESGARIFFGSSAYAEFANIKTVADNWETFEIYIEGSKISNNDLTLNLSLGYYSSDIPSAMLTTGYVFFDDLSLTKVTKKQYDEKVLDDHSKKLSYHVPNNEFDFGKMIDCDSTGVPNLWNIMTGGANTSSSAPTPYRYNGIVDTKENVFKNKSDDLATSRYIHTIKEDLMTKEKWNELPDTDKEKYFKHEEDGDNIKTYKNITTPMDYSKIVTNPGVPTNAIGTKVYMLSQIYMTAQGIKSATPIVVERGKYTKISVNVYTQNIFGQGVSIKLTGNGNDFGFKNISQKSYTLDDDEQEIEIYKVWNKEDNAFNYFNNKGETVSADNYIAGSTAGWQTYTFIVKGNDFMDTSFYLELWLGTGDTSENNEKTIKTYQSSGYSTGSDFKTYTSSGTFSKGNAFFDSIQIEDVTSTEYQTITKTVDYTTKKDECLIADEKSLAINLEKSNEITTNANFNTATKNRTIYDKKTEGTPNGWATDIKEGAISGVYLNQNTIAGTVDVTNDTFFTELGLKNPKSPIDGQNKILMVYSPTNELYKFESSVFNMQKNSAYRISVWAKTENIPTSTGLRLTLVNSKDDKTLKSSSVINTKDTDDNYRNDWVEYIFVVRTGNEELNAKLLLEYGYGDRWSATTLAKGAGYFAHTSCVNIPISTYSSLTSSSTNTASINKEETESSDKKIKNNAFNLIDLEKTEGIVDGELNDDIGVPKNWTKSDKTLDDKVAAGIIKYSSTDNKTFTTSTQVTTIISKNSETFNSLSNLYDSWSAPNGGPSALFIGNHDTVSHALGFKSDSFSLDANKYYTISVHAYANAGTKYSIYLSGENTVKNYFGETPSFNVTATTNGWTTYTFNVEVGLKSVSLYLNLWLGDNADVVTYENKDDAKTNGFVVYDSITCHDGLKAEDFEALTQQTQQRKLSFLADGFDVQALNAESKSKLSAVTGWTGSTGENCAETSTKRGIYYYSGNGSDYAISDLFGLNDEGTRDQTNGDHYKNAAKQRDFYPISETNEKLYSDVNLTILDQNGKYYKKSDTETITLETVIENGTEVLQKFKLNTEEKEISLIDYADLAPYSGQYALAINNIKSSAYSYKGSAYTLIKNSYYKISIFVKTNKIEGDFGASIALTANGLKFDGTEAIENNGKKFTGIKNTDWKEYTFYVHTEDNDISNLYLTLSLGEAETESTMNLAKGYALFDDFAIEKIKEADYTGVANSDVVHKLKANPADSETADPEDNKTIPYKPDLKYLAWMIPTILLAVAVIVVIIVLIVKKIRAKYPKKEEPKSSSYDTESKSSESINQKQNIYESKFNEEDGMVVEEKPKKIKKEKKNKKDKKN